MKRLLVLCLTLALASVATFAAPSVDEAAVARLAQLTRDFDQALVSGQPDRVAPLLHESYTYTGPEKPAPATAALPPAARRLTLGSHTSSEIAIRVVGPTAVVTGTYTSTEPVAVPRFYSRGRFTSTWIRTGEGWTLLAEHRSLNETLEWAPAPVAATTPAPPPLPVFESNQAPKKSGRAETHVRHGHLPEEIRGLFRAYEPTQIGYTKDQGDDPFMDFKFSAMFPLHPSARDYPDPVRRSTDAPFFRPVGYAAPQFYFAATLRAGQYIGTRPSSPVIGKRFNPLLAVRLWATEGKATKWPSDGRPESEDNFLELAYGHESNGQFIASPGRFDDQLRVYLNQALDAPTPDAATLAKSTAYLATRDNISRGWDYIGFQFARDWDTNFFDRWAPDATIAFRAKFNYFLRRGFLQGEAEEFNKSWETRLGSKLPDPEGRARKYVDGLSFRYTLTVAPPRDKQDLTGWSKLLRFERRYAVTYTTGYVQPFRFSTIKAEAGLNLSGLPLMLWYRYGYGSDLVDYYRKDHSYGLSLSFWNF